MTELLRYSTLIRGERILQEVEGWMALGHDLNSRHDGVRVHQIECVSWDLDPVFCTPHVGMFTKRLPTLDHRYIFSTTRLGVFKYLPTSICLLATLLLREYCDIRAGSQGLDSNKEKTEEKWHNGNTGNLCVQAD